MGAIVSPQAAAAWSGVVCLSRMAAAIRVMTQHWDLGGYSLSSLLKVFTPSLSTSTSSLLCPHFARDLLSVVHSFSCYSSHSALTVRLKHHRAGSESLLGSGLLFPTVCEIILVLLEVSLLVKVYWY